MLTQEQLALRKDKITGSTVAAYLGFSPYCSPVEQWELNAGLRVFEGNADTEAGNELERGLGEWALKDLGIVDGDWSAGTLIHPGEPCFAATPDVLIPSEQTGIQIKNHRPQMARKYLGKPGSNGKWDNALIPLHINFQCQWEAYVVSAACGFAPHPTVTTRLYWLLVSYFGGSDRRVYWIRQDPELIGAMVKAARKFWIEHLDPSGPRTPPTEIPWKGKPAKEARKIKLTGDELRAAPVPFAASGADPLAIKIPFSEAK